MSTTIKPTEDTPESSAPISADIVDDGIEAPTSNNLQSKSAQNNNNIITDSDNEDEDEFEDAEESEEDDDFEDAQENETQVEELDAAALLAHTKQRLEKAAPSTNHEHTTNSEEKIHSTTSTELNNNSEEATDIDKPPQSPDEEKKVDTIYRAIDEANEPVKDQAYYIELAMKKSKEAEVKAMQDDDPGYLMKLAEKKIADAEAKAKEDEAAMGDNVMKPVIPSGPKRSENSELWALLNYSKQRLETGTTPGVKKSSGSKNNSVRGDDNMSVSSKLSKSSKRSMRSGGPIAIVGGPGDDMVSPLNNNTDAPFPDVTDNGEGASVDGSVSLESGTKDRSIADDDNESDNSDDDDDDESSEEEEEELPDFLKDEDEAIDAEEQKAMYEAAKFKAASILSVSEEKLTDVQMLQAIAIAEEAAKKGDDKFSTKRSLFKLNEAKVEDLKSFLNQSIQSMKPKEEATNEKTGEAGWGRGRLFQRLGNAAKSFRERCEELDDQKQKEREGQPTAKDMLNAGMTDLKTQIDEYEKIVTSQRKKG